MLNFRRWDISRGVCCFSSLLKEFTNWMFIFNISNVTILFAVAWRIREACTSFWVSDNHCWITFLLFDCFIAMLLLSVVIVYRSFISRKIQLFIQDNIMVDLQWLGHYKLFALIYHAWVNWLYIVKVFIRYYMRLTLKIVSGVTWVPLNKCVVNGSFTGLGIPGTYLFEICGRLMRVSIYESPIFWKLLLHAN
jgi:hypothetical protein